MPPMLWLAGPTLASTTRLMHALRLMVIPLRSARLTLKAAPTLSGTMRTFRASRRTSLRSPPFLRATTSSRANALPSARRTPPASVDATPSAPYRVCLDLNAHVTRCPAAARKCTVRTTSSSRSLAHQLARMHASPRPTCGHCGSMPLTLLVLRRVPHDSALMPLTKPPVAARRAVPTSLQTSTASKRSPRHRQRPNATAVASSRDGNRLARMHSSPSRPISSTSAPRSPSSRPR